MAVSSSRGRRLTVGRIILRAYQVAGLKNVRENALSVEEMGLGKDLLDAVLDEMQAHGIQARTQDFEEITLVDGTYEYELGEGVLDVTGPGMYISPTDSDPAAAETYVLPVPSEDWQTISSKSASGRPTQYFPWRRSRPMKVRVWPVPGASEDGGTIRFMSHIHLSDADYATATLELEGYWNRYLFNAVGAMLGEAYNLPPQIIAARDRAAQRSFERAKGFARQHPPKQMVFSHRTPRPHRRYS